MDLAIALARLQEDPALIARLSAQWAERDALLIQHETLLEQHVQALADKERELKARDLKIQALILELAHHKRLRFGVKSEALVPEQRDLFEEDRAMDEAAIRTEMEQQQPATTRAKPKPSGRKPLPPELPRIEHRHEPDTCQCNRCGDALVKIGEDISEQLDIEPARFFVHRHIRPQYACRRCETVSAAPVPAAIIDGGMAAPGLHAWVVVQKYLDHLPLYRLEQIADRHGVPLARTTLAEWVGRIGAELTPLVDRLTERLKERGTLHADETPVQQLEPGSGKTRRAYVWAYRSNDLEGDVPIVVFDYQISRSGEHARNFLAGWKGHLMVDDYAGYKALFGHGITELGCLAHARRKFYELHAAHAHPVATEALRRIGELYAIEEDGRMLDTASRQALRRREAKPRLAALHDWLHAERLRTAEGSALRRAIDYSLKRWTALTRYAGDGSLPIDNNPVENVIRPICLGKKNWLFAGSERAGKRAAAIQSLLITAKLNGLEPYAWLKDTLEKLPTWLNSRIDELLPLRHRL